MSPTRKEQMFLFDSEPFWDVYDSRRLNGLVQGFMNQCRKRRITYFAEVGATVDTIISRGYEVEIGGVECVVLPRSVLDSIKERGLDDGS